MSPFKISLSDVKEIVCGFRLERVAKCTFKYADAFPSSRASSYGEDMKRMEHLGEIIYSALEEIESLGNK
jgi:hypothetical protein